MSTKRPYDALKRVLDFVTALVLLVLTAPIQLVVAALVSVKLGRPVLFRQARPGRNGRIFTLLKFRSMLPVDETRGRVSDADRLTPFGVKLRSTSLDELPTLWNVVRGDMSMVGPRPLLVEYLERYTPEQARRHEVRPGVTGLAQVSGRNAISWSEKFAFDVAYVDKRSFGLDTRIVAKTLSAVLSRRGINQGGHATMTKFGGE
ncbi:sugar transferase [Leucobacter sp. wl10]|uniref:sugar transferase n=1 Tax=Leucobacter sp. wl10 TaxID=2304677 RepID=UPI000E5C0A54|nr:sugar transferase [Leucobacter sp. wl10]RGE19778.1 sugar transferase [Leucobacter sp. wl10]